MRDFEIRKYTRIDKETAMDFIRRIVRAPDVFFAILGICAAVGVAIFSLMVAGRLVFLPVGVCILAACGGWLLMRPRFHLQGGHPPSSDLFMPLAALVLTLILLGAMAWYLRPDTYQRPLVYFVLTSLAAGLMTFQALTSTRRDVPLFLIEVLMIGISLAWSQTFLFPSLLGEDPWYHQLFTQQIITEMQVPPNRAYSGLPLFHLVSAVTWLLSAPTYKLAALFSVSLAQIVVNVIAIYVIGDALVKDHRVGLVAGLFVAVANQSIFMSTWSIPNGFAALFIPIIIYILVFRPDDRPLVRGGLLTLFMAAVILTHSVTAVCLAILLFVLWGVAAGYRRLTGSSGRLHIPWFVPLVFLGGMLSWWYLATGLYWILWDLIGEGFRSTAFDKSPEAIKALLTSIPIGEQVFNYLGYFIFFSLAIVGLLAFFRSRERTRVGYSLAGITPLAIGFSALVSGFAVLYERWWYFSEILLALPLGVAMVGMYIALSARPGRYLAWPAIGLLAVMLTFVLIMNPAAEIDNHLFSPNTQATFALTASEMEGTLRLVNGTDRLVRSDGFLAHSFGNIGQYIEPFDSEIFERNVSRLRSDLVIVRGRILDEPFKIYSTLFRPNYSIARELESTGFSRVYQNGGTEGFVYLGT
jgi:hypothetical protein